MVYGLGTSVPWSAPVTDTVTGTWGTLKNSPTDEPHDRADSHVNVDMLDPCSRKALEEAFLPFLLHSSSIFLQDPWIPVAQIMFPILSITQMLETNRSPNGHPGFMMYW